MTLPGFLLLATGVVLISLAIIPEIIHRIRIGTFYSRTPIYYGWIVLFIGALGGLAATSVSGQVMGGLQMLVSAEMGWTRSAIGFTVSTGVWLSGILAPLIGPLADRYGPRWLMPIGAVLLGVCLVILGDVNAFWQFFILAILIRSIGQPLFCGLVPRTVAVNFFQQKRNIALAFTAIIRPVSSAINIQVILAIATSKSWRMGFRYLGFATLTLAVPMFLAVRRKPEDLGILPYGAPIHGASDRRLESTGNSTISVSSQRANGDWTAKEAMSTRVFWLVAVATFLVLTASAGIGFNMMPYFHEKVGLSTMQAAGILSFSTLLSLTNLGWGQLADKFTPHRCLLWGLIGCTLSLTYLFTVNNLVSAWVFGVAFGAVHAVSDAVVPMLMAQYFGRNSYGTIMGAMRPFEAAGLGLGQSLGAVIHDLTGSYQPFIVICLASYVVAVILMLVARPPLALSSTSSPI